MEDLIFSLNAVIPVFLLMVLGFFLHKIGWVSEAFAGQMNKFVFQVPLPLMLFYDLATADFLAVWDGHFVLYCAVVTALSILISTGISFLLKDKSLRGEFIQSSYRSSAAILGIAFIQNVYGTSGMAPLMIIGSVPLYNVMAVVVLALTAPGQGGLDRGVVKKSIVGVLKNPIIIGIAAGFFWSILKIPMPQILGKTLSNVAVVATPMGLIAMGATFDFGKAFAQIRPALLASFFKLVGFSTLFLPVAVFMGFRQEKLMAILVMLGSATTVSSFVMAKNMKHEGVLTSSVVMLTTMFSAFTLTMWLYILKHVGFL